MAQAEQATKTVSTNHPRPLMRKPRRITVTVPDHIYWILSERSSREGRSISNLSAYLLERAVGSDQQSEIEEG
jgi:hypothetical protein